MRIVTIILCHRNHKNKTMDSYTTANSVANILHSSLHGQTFAKNQLNWLNMKIHKVPETETKNKKGPASERNLQIEILLYCIYCK